MAIIRAAFMSRTSLNGNSSTVVVESNDHRITKFNLQTQEGTFAFACLLQINGMPKVSDTKELVGKLYAEIEVKF